MAEEPPRGSYAIKYVCMYVSSPGKLEPRPLAFGSKLVKLALSCNFERGKMYNFCAQIFALSTDEKAKGTDFRRWIKSNLLQERSAWRTIKQYILIKQPCNCKT